jgi:hypothetical protein
MHPSPTISTTQGHITLPSTFSVPLLSPPPTDQLFAQARRVIALFKNIQDGHAAQASWEEFQLVSGEYDAFERQLHRDEGLRGYVEDKVRCEALEEIEFRT